MTAEVIRLSSPSTAQVFDLREHSRAMPTLGRGAECTFPLTTDDLEVGDVHARLTCTRGTWTLAASDDTRGLWLAGARCLIVELQPWLEVGLSRTTTLVAEGEQSRRLRALLRIVLDPTSVDSGMTAIRRLAVAHEPLVISGTDDARWLAERVHRFVAPTARFKIVSGREDFMNGPLAWDCAGNTICLPAHQRSDVGVVNRLAQIGARAIVCTGESPGLAAFRSLIRVPRISPDAERRHRTIHFHATEAMVDLEIAPWILDKEQEQQIVLASDQFTHRAIALAARRLLCTWTSDSIAAASRRLDVSRVALTNWLGRRGL